MGLPGVADPLAAPVVSWSDLSLIYNLTNERQRKEAEGRGLRSALEEREMGRGMKRGHRRKIDEGRIVNEYQRQEETNEE